MNTLKDYIKHLRSLPESKHCKLEYYEDGQFCAIGALTAFEAKDENIFVYPKNYKDHYEAVVQSLPVGPQVVIDWNDEEDLSFAEIADRLEEAAKC